MLVLSFNMVIFVIVIVVLVRHLRKRSKDTFGTLRLMANITGVVFLFGLTWLFGALTVVNLDHVFQILFTLANSFQGFVIFIFFCVLNSDVRMAWMRQLFGKRFAFQLMGKRLRSQPKTDSVTKLHRNCQDTSKESEPFGTEELVTLGSPAKLVCTLSEKGNHINEVAELVLADKAGLDEREASGDDVKLSNLTGQWESGV